MARGIWLTTLGTLLLLSPAALGQQSSSKAEASALFRQGRAAFDKGDYAQACPKFAESLRLEPAPGTRLNLAVCEERTGKFVSARQHLDELIPQLSARDERVPFAKDLLAKVEKRICRLTLTLAKGAPRETEVRDEREGKALLLEKEIMLDPGDYDLSITAPGRPPDRLRLTLTEGQRETRTITPLPAPVGSDKNGGVPKPPPKDSGPNVGRTLGFVAGGVGIAAFGVAAVTGVVLLNKKSEVDVHCPHKNDCDEEGDKLLAAAQKTPLLPLNTAAWVLGIAGVGAGTVLILVSSTKKSAEPKTTAFATVLPFGGGLGVRGSF